MFQDCRLGLKDHDPKRLAKHVRLSPDDVDTALISSTPRDWQRGLPWDGDDCGNRKLGNCGPAAVVHWSNLMAKAAGIPVIYGREEAERIYRIMGWDGTEAGDDGTVLLDVMCQWMLEPFCGRKLTGFYVIGHADDDHISTANWFAPCIVGASLTRACQKTQIWNAAAADPSNRIWGNHAYLYFSNSPGGGNGNSWGRPTYTTDEFRKRRWNECYLPICEELMPGIDLGKVIRVARQL